MSCTTDQVDALVIGDVTSVGTSGHLQTSQAQTSLGNDGHGTITGLRGPDWATAVRRSGGSTPDHPRKS
jgi:hypothetical protein